MGTAPSRVAAPAAAASSEGTARTSRPLSCARPLAVAQPIRSPVKLPGPSPSTIPSRSPGRAPARESTKSTRRRISAACRRAPGAWAPASTVAPLPTATLATSVAVSIASQPPLIPTPPNAERGTRKSEQEPAVLFRVPNSAFRVPELDGDSSRHLLEMSDVGRVAIAQFQVPLERRQPRGGALRPLHQNDRALSQHVLERQVLGLVRRAEAVAVDVVDGNAGDVVVVHQGISRAGGEGAGAEATADRLDEGGLAGAEVARQADHGRRAERAPQRFTEPAELVRVETHGAPGLPRPPPPPPPRPPPAAQRLSAPPPQRHPLSYRRDHQRTSRE